MKRGIFTNTRHMDIDEAFTEYLKERKIPESAIISIDNHDKSYSYGGRLIFWYRETE